MMGDRAWTSTPMQAATRRITRSAVEGCRWVPVADLPAPKRSTHSDSIGVEQYLDDVGIVERVGDLGAHGRAEHLQLPIADHLPGVTLRRRLADHDASGGCRPCAGASP